MAKITSVNSIPANFLEFQTYTFQDDTLITNFISESGFNPLENYIEYYVYTLNNQIEYSEEFGYSGYRFIDGNVIIDPLVDLETVGFNEGNYNVLYNFLNTELNSSPISRFYIDEISSDRTEIRLNTVQISNLEVIAGAELLQSKISNNPGVYFDFYLNFGQNQLIIANNILLDNSNTEDPTILIKLYEPLPLRFELKSECWVVTEVAEPVAFNVAIRENFEFIEETIQLSGPNYNLGVKDELNNSTEYISYSSLQATSSYSASSSSSLYYQINSILAERGIEINVDYSDYSNFIYFSSALTRLENFYYKLQLIEEYQYSSSLNAGVFTNTYISSSANIWQAKIDEIITTFDGYDYYLYYSSGSTAWPKTNSTYPYNNASTTSIAGVNFMASQGTIAEGFDEENNNALINSIPLYLREDEANAQYELFIEMLGEMFDNIWIYYQDVTNKFNADNRLQYGVSKNLVADILRDLGLKIYENSFSSKDLYLAFLGVTSDGNTFPFPYITGSYPVPTGYEYIDTKISASNDIVPLQDIEYSFYKRLYHNLPLLLKKKGTTVGLQDLITTYGIPSTILRVAEFGGKDKDESNDWDYYKQRYNYKYDTSLTGFISSSWVLNSNWSQTTPGSVQFRFKLPSSGSTGAVDSAVNFPSQSLWQLDTDVKLVLEYTGSGFASGSYSGSSIDSYYQYGTLKLIPDAVNNPNQSASVYLPFFNGGWWSVMATIDSDVVSLYAGNNLYNGDDGSQLGFYASASISSVDDGEWLSGTFSYFATGSTGYDPFSGSLQEVRYYTVVLEENDFKDFIMNPDSIESNGINNTPDQLAFRASLGGELFTGSVSIHPKVTGSWIATSSFTSDSNFYTGSGTFSSNVETVYLDQPTAGIKNIVSNKIQIVDMNLPSGSTLSQYRSIQQQPPGGSTYTENLAYTEIGFSPQNEINDDIMDQLGFFNMGEYIGDPRQRFNQDNSYPDLDRLRNAYFEKYKSNYNIFEYINLIKYFDNSLFKMIKDFTPARSSLSSGVIVKQHLLERNKYPQPEVTQSLRDFSGSIDTAFVEGGAGGSVNQFNGVTNDWGVTQSWQETIIIPSGVITQTHDSQDEFYNGEFSGSEFIVENGELNEANTFKGFFQPEIEYSLYLYVSSTSSLSSFLNSTVSPNPGEIYLWYDTGSNLNASFPVGPGLPTVI